MVDEQCMQCHGEIEEILRWRLCGNQCIYTLGIQPFKLGAWPASAILGLLPRSLDQTTGKAKRFVGPLWTTHSTVHRGTTGSWAVYNWAVYVCQSHWGSLACVWYLSQQISTLLAIKWRTCSKTPANKLRLQSRRRQVWFVYTYAGHRITFYTTIWMSHRVYFRVWIRVSENKNKPCAF